MKTWHVVVIVIVAYIVGALYPAAFVMARAKLGV